MPLSPFYVLRSAFFVRALSVALLLASPHGIVETAHRMHFKSGVLHVGEVSVAALAAQHGTPLYVYDGSVIRRQIDRIREAFGSIPFQPYYAVKANDNLAILRMIRDAGFGCDCVSPGEIFLARRAGIDPSMIWFTASGVSDADLLSIDDARIVVNVNSLSELERCARLALPNPVAIRVNPEIGAGHHPDVVTGGFSVKFGVDPDEIDEAIAMASSGSLRVDGLHAHIGSGIETIEPLLESARRLIELSSRFEGLRWLNFGGGLAVPYRPGEAEFPIREYGDALARATGPVLRARGMTGILEPGRYVIAESGMLVARVTSKRMRDGVVWLGCDTGFNHLVRPSKYGAYHHIVNVSHGSDQDLRTNPASAENGALTVVAGNLCESGDVFTRRDGRVDARPIPSASVGDLLAFCDAGAYGYSMASSYNARPLPVEILVEVSEARRIRRRQSFEDLASLAEI